MLSKRIVSLHELLVHCCLALLFCTAVFTTGDMKSNGNGVGSATWERGPSRRNGWEWMGRDAFDEFIDEFDTVRADNCQDHFSMRMPLNTISQTISYNGILSVRNSLSGKRHPSPSPHPFYSRSLFA